MGSLRVLGREVAIFLQKALDFIKKYKASIGAAAVTALLLDIVTGVIFGFGGALLFAAV